jgi:DNA-binding protein Fis
MQTRPSQHSGSNTAIDFFYEVQKFEVKLIKRALDLADGNQARAAKLLGWAPPL